MNEVEMRIVDIIQDLSGLYVYDVSMTLSDELALDSLKMVMLLVLIEEEFNIEFDESDINPKNILTVSDVIDLSTEYVYNLEVKENE